MFQAVQFLFKIGAVAILQVRVLFVASLEELGAGMQEVKDAADTEHVAGLIVDLSSFTVLQDLRCNEAESSAAVVTYILVLELLLSDG